MTCRYDQIGKYKVYISRVNCTSNRCAVEPIHYSVLPVTALIIQDYSTQAGSVILTKYWPVIDNITLGVQDIKVPRTCLQQEIKYFK